MKKVLILAQFGDALGSELVNNGNFATGDNWTFANSGGSFGWQIASGRAICDGSAPTPFRNLQQTMTAATEVGKSYRCTIDILQSADAISFTVGGVATPLPTGTNLGYTFDVTATSATTFLSIFAGTDDLQEIDNVSVKEIL